MNTMLAMELTKVAAQKDEEWDWQTYHNFLRRLKEEMTESKSAQK